MSPRPKHVWLPGYMRADCVDLFLVSYLRPAIVCLTWLLAFSTSHYHSFKAYERLKRCTRLFGINTMLLCVERSLTGAETVPIMNFIFFVFQIFSSKILLFVQQLVENRLLRRGGMFGLKRSNISLSFHSAFCSRRGYLLN